jgi:hypothetical protein
MILKSLYLLVIAVAVLCVINMSMTAALLAKFNEPATVEEDE